MLPGDATPFEAVKTDADDWLVPWHDATEKEIEIVAASDLKRPDQR